MQHSGARMSIQTTNRMRDIRKRYMEHVERRLDEEIGRIMIRLTDLILPTVPVWSGETLANWRWCVGVPDEEVYEPDAQSLPEGPAINGQEHRRPANEEKVRRSLQRALLEKDKHHKDIFFLNPAPMAVPLEYDINTPAGRDARGRVRTAIAQVRNARAR